MGKYDRLFRHLAAADASTSVEMTFDEIERLVGPLPASASRYSAWWTNEVPTRPMCTPWHGSTLVVRSSVLTATAGGCGSVRLAGGAAPSLEAHRVERW
jgi:hypothetical protein